MIGRWGKCLWITVCLVILAAGAVNAADDSNLAARAASWEKEYNAGNVDAVVAMYAADGCRMPPNAETVRGSEAIKAEIQKGRDMGAVKIKIAVTTAETSGDSGHGAGTYELMKADGSTMDRGKWMNVSKKMGGAWKIQCDIWNSDMPLPTPPPGK